MQKLLPLWSRWVIDYSSLWTLDSLLTIKKNRVRVACLFDFVSFLLADRLPPVMPWTYYNVSHNLLYFWRLGTRDDF
jgi:hypothetical protein